MIDLYFKSHIHDKILVKSMKFSGTQINVSLQYELQFSFIEYSCNEALDRDIYVTNTTMFLNKSADSTLK